MVILSQFDLKNLVSTPPKGNFFPQQVVKTKKKARDEKEKGKRRNKCKGLQ
jgi:hypothetical protein